MKSLRLLFPVICLFILVACQQQEEQQIEMTPITDKSEIVGKWRERDKTIEIFEDGKMAYTDRLRKEPIIGSYELVNGNILRGTYPDSGTHEYKASMWNGKLILQGIQDGSTSRLTKVNK